MLKAIFTNSFGILFSRILGFFRDLLTASFLGANIYSDIFFIAFKLPNLFRRIFAEGAFTQTFIPSFTRSRHKGVFAVYILSLFFLVILFLSLGVTLFPRFATQLIAIGFDNATVLLAAPFVAVNFWYLPLIFGVTFLASLLQYKHHFATTAFSTALLNISLITALLLAKEKTSQEIVLYLSIGVIAGGVLQLLLHIFVIRKLGLCKILLGGFQRLSHKLPTIKNEVQKFKKEFFPAIWGNSTAQVSAFLDTWLASFLVSGTISYLYYANRVFQLPLALFAIATSTAVFPKISRYLKNGDEEKARFHMKKAFWFLLYLLSLSTIGGFLLADEITALLFQRGAFTSTDSNHTALILQAYMVGLLPFGLSKLFSLWLYASQKQLHAAKIATYSLGTNIILSLVFIFPFGGMGLALASSFSGFVSFFFLVRAFGKKEFFRYFQTKHSLFLLGSSFVFVIILLVFKNFIHTFV